MSQDTFVKEAAPFLTHKDFCSSLSGRCVNCTTHGHVGRTNQHFSFDTRRPCAHCPCKQFKTPSCDCGFDEFKTKFKAIL